MSEKPNSNKPLKKSIAASDKNRVSKPNNTQKTSSKTNSQSSKYKITPKKINKNSQQKVNNRAVQQKQQPSKQKTTTPRQKRLYAEKKRRKREIFTAKLIIFLTFYVLINLVIVGYIALSIKNTPDKIKKVELLQIQIDEDNKINIPSETLYKNNILYIPYEDLDSLCNFNLSGDRSKITLILNYGNLDSGIDYVSFYRNSDLIYVSGAPHRLSSPVLFEKDDYYIPAEFVDNFMKGISLELDETKNKYTMSLTLEPLTFIGKFPAATDKVDESTVPEVSDPITDTSEDTAST